MVGIGSGPHPRKLAVNTPPHPGGGRFHRNGGYTCPGCGGLMGGGDLFGRGKDWPWAPYHPRCRVACGGPSLERGE